MLYVDAISVWYINCLCLSRGRGLNYACVTIFATEEVEKLVSVNKQIKEQVVNEIRDKFERAASIILVDYRGLSVAEATELRKKFREAGAEYKVYKNTLMHRAMEALGFDDILPYLTGPNAVAIGYDDPVTPAKIIAEFAKEANKLELKVGIVDKQFVDAEGVKSLSELPSREELVARVLGGLNSPVTGFVNVLQGNIRNLVYVLDAVREKKSA